MLTAIILATTCKIKYTSCFAYGICTYLTNMPQLLGAMVLSVQSILLNSIVHAHAWWCVYVGSWRHVSRGWLHGGSRRQCTRLAAEEEWRTMAAREDVWHILSSRPSSGHYSFSLWLVFERDLLCVAVYSAVNYWLIYKSCACSITDVNISNLLVFFNFFIITELNKNKVIVIALSNLDPHKLGIRCRLNGETVQNSNTDQLVFKTEDLVAWISQ